MCPLTIKELSTHLLSLVAKGYGDYSVEVSDDEEVNGAHMIFGNFHAGGHVTYLNEKTHAVETNNSILIS